MSLQAAGGACSLVDEPLRLGVHRDGEADADTPHAAGREDRLVDADDLTFDADERPAGVPEVDGCIGLYPIANQRWDLLQDSLQKQQQ